MSGKQELSNSDSTSEESTIEVTKEKITAKIFVLLVNQNKNDFLIIRYISVRILKILKIKESP